MIYYFARGKLCVYCGIKIHLNGGIEMATSSILENIYVNNPKAIEEFVAAMDSRRNILPEIVITHRQSLW